MGLAPFLTQSIALSSSKIEIDEDKAMDWVKKGAKPTDAVQKIFEKVNIMGSYNK